MNKIFACQFYCILLWMPGYSKKWGAVLACSSARGGGGCRWVICTQYKSGCTHLEFTHYQRQIRWSAHWKTCDTLTHPRAASVEPSWLEATHFKKLLYSLQDVCLWSYTAFFMYFKCWFCGPDKVAVYIYTYRISIHRLCITAHYISI